MKIILFVIFSTLIRTVWKVLFPGKSKEQAERNKIRINNFIGSIVLIGIFIGTFYYYVDSKKKQSQRYINNRAYFKEKKKNDLNDFYERKNQENKMKGKTTYDYKTNTYSGGGNSQTKAARDNRSNQMNPNNSAWGSSRNSGGGNQGQSRASMNNRSNQMNPNNSAYKGGKK